MIRPCPVCGKKNRVPADHLADIGRCGSCGGELQPLAEAVDVESAAIFDEIVKGARVPVLIDFWAAWCGPCRMAAPEVKKVAAEMAGKAVVLKVDTEKHQDIAQRFKVMSIPNFVVMKNGKMVKQQPGLVDHTQMAAWLRQVAV